MKTLSLTETAKDILTILLLAVILGCVLTIIKLGTVEAQSLESVYYQTMGFTLVIFAGIAGVLSLNSK